ncbi:MAG: AI-2E family transporter [Firmicutes bacterium]|nr:AI-2E family transporter [Bacillota bacterium]
MLKNKLDFKLINFAIITLVIFLMYQTSEIWLGLAGIIIKIITPLFLAFILAYVLHPYLKFLTDRKVPKSIAVVIVILTVLVVLGLILGIAFPMLFSQLGSLFNGIIAFIKEISLKFDLNFGNLQETLSGTFNQIIERLGTVLSNGAANFIGISVGYITVALISFSASIYILVDMDKIRDEVGDFLKKKSRKVYRYVVLLDEQMKSYLTGFFKIVLITAVEYSLAFLIIGHPNALLLGFLAALASLIPYFGGIITNCIAAITAFVISPALFIRTVIAFVILSTLDGYVINPLMYGKTNKVHPLVVILSVFVGGTLFGIGGVILSLPVAIIMVTTYKYFKEDISDKIEDMKTIKKKTVK